MSSEYQPPARGERHQGGETFVVELEALSSDVPPVLRLRQFLKAALRSWRVRCRAVTETTPQLPPLPEPGPADVSEVPPDAPPPAEKDR